MDYNIRLSFLSVLHTFFEGKFQALWLLNSQLLRYTTVSLSDILLETSLVLRPHVHIRADLILTSFVVDSCSE